METTTYDLEYFIAKFEAIPEELWTDKGSYIDDNGCKCAYGHCGVVDRADDTDEGRGLLNVEIEAKYNIVSVNDNKSGEYSHFGSTPKQRVVNYLKSLRK